MPFNTAEEMRGGEQGNFLEMSVREKMKGVTFLLMQDNSLSGESRDCCFAAHVFRCGYTSKLRAV